MIWGRSYSASRLGEWRRAREQLDPLLAMLSILFVEAFDPRQGGGNRG